MYQRARAAQYCQVVSRSAPPDKRDIPRLGFPAHGVQVRIEYVPHKSLVRKLAVGLLSPPIRHAEPTSNTDHQADTVDPDAAQTALVLERGAYPAAGFGYCITPRPVHRAFAIRRPYRAQTVRHGS